ncbi:hypothetical protein HY041_03360 [Candidatus Roizmanbacteria bacterium]|nr:hypothetical protein [Candidatus Roizmanbacteria bacterium]
MKKITLIFLFLFTAKLAYSDQLAWLTKDQAEQTITYFQNHNINEVILYCGCCDGDTKIKVAVSKIYSRQATDPQYWEIVIEGTTPGGNKIIRAVDLAYVHIKRGSKARCLGKELGFYCDPCVKPFKWY